MRLSIQQKLSQLDAPDRPEKWASLLRLAKLTALKRFPTGEFHLGHWWRGPLLYSLVQHYSPKHVLEFGTGRGYGAICMAQAAADAGIDCTIWTIDSIPPTALQQWAINEGNGPQLKQLSLHQIWQQYVPPAITARIRLLTGDSRMITRQWGQKKFPNVDFCFIDGGHDYWTVKHDFIAALKTANKGCSFLFDDCTQRKGYGVDNLIRKEIIPRLPPRAIEIIDVLSRDKTIFGEDVAHKMAFVSGEYIPEAPIKLFYSPSDVDQYDWQYSFYRRFRFIFR